MNTSRQARLAVTLIGMLIGACLVTQARAGNVSVRAPGVDIQIGEGAQVQVGSAAKSRSHVANDNDADDELEMANQSLQGVDWSRRQLAGANLTNADLSGANLAGANLSRANLVNTNFAGADLSGASLSGANIVNARFKGAVLTNAVWVDGHRCKADSIGRCR